MSNDDKTRDIIYEMADVLALLGDDYTLTGVKCDPGDSAARVTKRNSEKTLYIIAYSDPDDTEIQQYDENDSLANYHIFCGEDSDKPTPAQLADLIRKSL